MTENDNLHEEPSYLIDTGKRKGIKAWLTTTDHKRIGLLYLWSIMVFFIVEGNPGETMRTELFKPGQQILWSSDIQCYFYAAWTNHDLSDRDPGADGCLRQLCNANYDRRQ